MPRLAAATLLSACLALALAPLVVGGRSAASPRGPAQTPRLEFLSQVGGGSFALALSGERAYLPTGPTIQVLDPTPLGRPGVLGVTPPLPGAVFDVAVEGARMVAAVGDDGLAAFDLTTPDRPRLLGTVTSAPAAGVALSGTLAAAAAPNGDLRLVETGAAPPRVTGIVTTTPFLGPLASTAGGYFGLVAQHPITPTGGIAYVRTAGGAPWIAGTFGPDGHDLAVADNRLAVTTDEGVELYDVSAPAAPQRLGAWGAERTEQPLGAVALQGDFAAAATQDGSVVLVDFSAPAAPVARARRAASAPARALALHGNRILLALAGATGGGPPRTAPFDYSGGLAVFSTDIPSNLLSWSLLETPSGKLTDVAVAGATVLVTDAGRQGHVWRIEAGEGAVPLVDGVAETTGRPLHVVTRPGFGIVSSAAELLVVDTTVPHILRPALHAPALSQGSADIALDASYLFAVGTDVQGYSVMDISNLLAPRRLALDLVPTMGDAAAVAVGQGRLFAAGESGIRILDVRIPTAPRSLADIAEAGPDRGVAGQGWAGFVAHRLDGLKAVDASAVLDIHEAGGLPGAPLVAVAHAQDRVLTLDEQASLSLVDVADIDHPRALAHLSAPAPALDHGRPITITAGAIAVRDDLVFVAHPARGLLVYRAADPNLAPTATSPPAPTRTTVYLPVVSQRAEIQHLDYGFVTRGAFDPLNTEPHGLALARGVLFAGTTSGPRDWVASLDVSQPASVVEIGRMADLGGPALQLVPAGPLLYAALGEAGAAVVDETDPRAPRLIGRVKADHSIERLALGDGILCALDLSRSGHTTLRVLSLTDPAAPSEIGRIELTDTVATDVEVRGPRAYIATPAGLALVSLDPPSQPALELTYPLRGVHDTVLGGDLVYAVNQGETTQGGLPGGVWILDARQAPPREMGSLVSIDWPEVQGDRRIGLSGPWALSSSQDGVRIVDVTVPGWPRLLAQQEGGLAAVQDAGLAGRRVYVSDTSAGVVILDVTTSRP